MKICASIPYYNHPVAISVVVEQLLAHNLDCIIIVDDGSDVESKRSLIPLLEKKNVVLVSHDANSGKGAAVITGLREALKMGYTHVLQVDADGQHDLSKLSEFLLLASKHPKKIISGMPVYDETVPTNRKMWRYATHILVWIHTLSFEIRDSMCGFRVYPIRAALDVIDSINQFGQRMDFDIEVLVRANWAGLHTIQMPVSVRYPLDGVSHFKLFNDNYLITKMHIKLFFGMLLNCPKLILRKVRWV